jgi:ubiquinone biosynthesis protein
MKELKEKYKNFKRLKEILSVISRYGFGYFLNLPKIERYFRFGRGVFTKKGSTVKHLTLPERARLAMEELGPTFVKLGQILSTRPDLIPQEFADEFSKLQDNVAGFSNAQVEECIKKELGRPINELFAEFEEIPVAAASLSQVHKAKLSSGEIVAVKIQRPDIEDRINTDISILFDLVQFVEKRMVNGQAYQPIEIVKEFAKAIKKELDFVNEARNIDKFRNNFKYIENVRIPLVYWDLTSIKVLTMEFIDGVKIAEVIKSDNEAYNKKMISARGADMILKQIFEDGYFHGDPHPGNIFITDNNTIALLDFGMVGRVDESMMANMANLLIGAIENNVDKIITALKEMDIIVDKTEIKELRAEIKDFVDKYYGVTLKQLEIGTVIEEVLEIVARHRVKIPADISLLVKALVTIEGVGRDLDPDFDMVAHAKPFAKDLLRKKYSLGNLWRKGSGTMEELLKFLEILPKELSFLVKSLRKGDLNINFRHQGLENIILEIDRASNRISFSMIIAALIVGSSLLLTQNLGPYIFGYPAIGIIGYLFASFLGLFLIISILRSGRWK